MLIVHFLEARSELALIRALLNWAKHCSFPFVHLGPVNEHRNYSGHEMIAVFDTGGDYESHLWL